MSLISVDFVSLDTQSERISECAEAVEGIHNDVMHAYRLLEDMKPGNIRDEIYAAGQHITELSDSILSLAKKLSRISELYYECEESIVLETASLLSDMLLHDGNNAKDPSGDVNGVYIDSEKLGQLSPAPFFGHSVLNDDWLDELIFNTNF